MKIKRIFAAIAAALLVASLNGTAIAATPKASGPDAAPKTDNLKNPKAEKQAALRQQAQEMVLKGEATPKGDNRVVKVAKGQYVELARQGEDDILTLLGEFGDQIHPTYGGDPGPVHNQIPEPDRSVDNTSIWTSDFTKAYYEDMLFSEAPGDVSMRNYYIEQSSNRYTVHGDVQDWVTVPYNEARYGTDACGDIVCSTVWRYVNDVADAFAATKSTADLNAYLAQFDVWDRYDADGDGNFNEPDGYIDHFQTVHAGSGEETGGGAQGADAIWSHRWYAYFPGSFVGPDGAGPHDFGGIRIGDSNYWIGDYTVEPEDGGVGVFSHEFGHDLGLPDLYDTSGNVGGAENSTGFWTIYSSGSYGSTGKPEDGIGTKPVDMSALEKIQLGWSNYALVPYGKSASIRLGPAESTTKQAQQIVALLPDKQVDFDLGSPASGSYFWHSGSGNNLDSSMTSSFTLPAGENAFAAKVNYDTEATFDFFYLRVSDDNGASWTSLPTNLSDAGTNGTSGSSGGAWVDWTATIPASYGGKTVLVRIEYITDGGVSNPGVNVDDVSVAGGTPDGAETDGTWTLAGGFVRTTGTVTRSFFNAYFAEFRQYVGYDASLRTGPYNFGFLDDPDLQDWVEHFSYPAGLVVWYYDESFPDNNVGSYCRAGRCGGLFLPVDAHPALSHWTDGTLMRPRILSRDSAFGLTDIPALTVHRNSVPATIPTQKANPLFDDDQSYWSNCDTHGCTGSHPGAYQPGWYSVNVPHTGTTMRVRSISTTGFMQVEVN